MNKRGEATYKDQFTPWMRMYLVTRDDPVLLPSTVEEEQVEEESYFAILNMMHNSGEIT